MYALFIFKTKLKKRYHMLLRQIHWNEVKGLDGISGDHFKKSVEIAFNFFTPYANKINKSNLGDFTN